MYFKNVDNFVHYFLKSGEYINNSKTIKEV